MSDAYLYKKIEEEIKEQISSGVLAAGDKVPSVKDIRGQHGVSHITALRVLKELANDNYIQFIKGKGYFVNAAQDYENGQELSYTIACITRPSRESTLHDNYYNDINQAIQRTCMSKGFDTFYPRNNLILGEITVQNSDLQELKTTISQLADRVDGFLIDERVSDPILIEIAEKENKPMLVVGRKTDARMDSVSPDNINGAKQVAELSLKMGYQNFILCDSLYLKVFTSDRVESFQQALEDNGISADNITKVGYNIGPNEDALINIKKYIDPSKKTLIFSPTDSFARYLVDVFTLEQVKLGDMLGIVGFCGMGYATIHQPHVTTVDIHPQLMGEKAASVLISRIKGEFFEKVQNFTVPSTFIIGETL